MDITRYIEITPVRYVTMAGGSCIITVALFFLMHSLIQMGAEAALDDVEPNKVIDFVRLKKRQEPSIEDRELPEKIQEKAPPPPDMAMPTSSKGGMSLDLSQMNIAPPKPDIQLGDLQNVGSSSAGIIPMVRVQPMYPPAAANQRIEGWVELKFTISTTGSVKSPRVLRAYPSDIFNQAALQAIKKWKYKPRVEAGEKVETTGVAVRLKFELDDMK
jgi:protein TonB